MSAAAPELPSEPPERAPGRRRAARLAAVQALYQLEMMAGDPESVILEFLTERQGVIVEGERVLAMDRAFFSDLVRGAARHRQEIDRLLAAGLAEGWRLERIERVLQGILRAAAYELMVRTDVPAKATINEYVEVAHAFLEDEQSSFVNAILDRIARQLRPGDFTGDRHDRAADPG